MGKETNEGMVMIKTIIALIVIVAAPILRVIFGRTILKIIDTTQKRRNQNDKETI